MLIYLLIPLAPLAAFLFLALGGRRLGDASHKVGVAAVGASFALSLAAFVSVVRSGPIAIPLYRLLESATLSVDLGLYIDQLAVLLLPLVTGVSFVVHVYSSRYMIGDPRYKQFFAVLGLFTFAMIMLVMSSNLLMVYVFWEVMGICSYLLISHWRERKAAAMAATKAFLVNAVADVGLGFGVILTFAVYKTLDLQQILAQAPAMSGETINVLGWLGSEWLVGANTLITLFLFMGALGKSAQVPLHVWLPHAMEAPTPVSALIHAATMVNAGPFLLVRLSPLVILAPSAMIVIAAIGAVTALYGGLVSLTQADIKKLLAYSTIGQIGFMIFACGVGAFVAAVFHLLAHGFLKGFLFLSAGTALEAAAGHAHGEHRTGPYPKIWRSPSLSAGALLLACVPPLVIFWGPYERVWAAAHLPLGRAAFWALGLVTVFLTGVYVFRATIRLFEQSFSVRDAGAREGLTVRPLLISAPHVPAIFATAAVVGALLLGIWSWLPGFLTPAVGRVPGGGDISRPSGLSWWLAAGLLTAVAGWGVAYLLHQRSTRRSLADQPWARTVYVLLLNRLYFDEIYDAYVVRPVVRFSNWLWRDVDRRGIDGLIHGVGVLSVQLSRWILRAVEGQGMDRMVQGAATASVGLSEWLWRVIDLRGTDRAVEGLGRQADCAGQTLQRLEPRTLQHHLVVVVFGLVLTIGLLYSFVF